MLIAGVVAAGARTRAARVLTVLSVVLCSGVVAQPAWAGKGVVGMFGSSGAGDGQFANAYATAVNLSSTDVYVVDQGNNRVERFDAGGAFLGAFGWGVADGSAAAQTCSSNCQAGLAGSGDGQFDTPQGIAIDQSDGSVYVVDGPNNNRVEKFDASGNFVSQFGSAGSGDGQLSGPQGIAVDPTDGSIYVADSANNRVVKFDSSGTFVDTFGEGVSDGAASFEVCTSSCQAGLPDSVDGAFNGPTRVAVDSTGRVYVLDANNGRIERFTSADAFDEQFDPTDVFIPQDITIGPGNDHLYVAQWAQDFSEQRVVEIDGSGSLVDTHGVGSTATNSSGLAVGPGDQKIYLADGFNARVFILDDVTPPTVTIDPPTNVTSSGASVSGTVNPNGNTGIGWHFEISTNEVFWNAVGPDQDPGSGNSPVPVSQSLTNLLPNRTYFVRLVATRAFNAPAISAEVQFTTLAVPPDATADVAQDITPDHVSLRGFVHPHRSPTAYYFEYGTTATYGASVPATQDGDAGAVNRTVEVVQPIYGLAPSTTYHYRLVAQNSAGTTQSADQTFTTTSAPPPSLAHLEIPGTGFLPDGRAWEKTSPADKNGTDVVADSGRTSIASDGSAATFSSLGAFGDPQGTSIATDYMNVRGADGWSTHAITPLQSPTTVPALLRSIQSYYVGYSTDLSKGVFLGWSPVTPDPNVAQVGNLYQRDDLKDARSGSYQLLTSCSLCASTSTPLPPLLGDVANGGLPRFAGASSDFGHVIFESQERLTGDAPGNCASLRNVNQCPPKLYEWDHGTVRLVGILPNGTPAPHGSQAGQGAGASQGTTGLTPHTISADGSRIIFTVPDAPRSQSGALYMRIDHATTVQINASERTDCADNDLCTGAPEPDPSGTQSATYWDASTDGLRVFFTSTEALTDDTPANGSTHLYMYDASKPANDPHNLRLVSVSANEPLTEVINVQGASSDGHYVYFAAAGQLVAGRPQLGTVRALFGWHDGTIRYIASMGDFTDNPEDTNTNSWTFFRPTARVTPDGDHLLFSSSASGPGPTGYDQGACHTLFGAGCRELYLYSFDSQRLACVSCNPTGAPATASATIAQRVNGGNSSTTPVQSHPLSDDGRHVFFSTAEALVPQDVNGKVDVYEYDAPSGTVHLISSGTDLSDSYFLNASPSGDDVAFVTRSQLVGSDTDTNYDLYDARVGGGFPEPASGTVECSADACQGPQSHPPDARSPGSSLVTGTTRPSPPKRKSKPKPHACRKGYVHKKVHGKTKCVRKSKAHKGRKAARARHGRSQRRPK